MNSPRARPISSRLFYSARHHPARQPSVFQAVRCRDALPTRCPSSVGLHCLLELQRRSLTSLCCRRGCRESLPGASNRCCFMRRLTQIGRADSSSSASNPSPTLGLDSMYFNPLTDHQCALPPVAARHSLRVDTEHPHRTATEACSPRGAQTGAPARQAGRAGPRACRGRLRRPRGWRRMHVRSTGMKQATKDDPVG